MTAVDAQGFFRRTGAHSFSAMLLVQGAWSKDEQHIAPALGLLAHAIETDLRERQRDDLQLGRMSYDILGTLPIADVQVDVAVLRSGRTIELVEARLLHANRPVLLARAWLLKGFDTSRVAGTSFRAMPPPDQLEAWQMGEIWGGACIASLEVRRRALDHGHALAWVRTPINLVQGEDVSRTATVLGLVDIANGIGLRISPESAAFPNIDLTVHLFRRPCDGWLGFDTTVSLGDDGIGLTHSVLHDQDGPVGVVAQCLTVRPY